ncbi:MULTISPECIES: carbohydrate ABC transporter permease [Streptomyces]|uniref:Sugar ABC transporter n=1 Tax=Streptomyces albus (strain ATCC 21838 / DSM 41398 / FERM P-419 / JCM 4703 / NBRC 107858) TaxID=1081613 RepID=A0A0B5F9S6_STRA4|nr:carbohydrate ABC transporter permease [Streptomyces sp. SCSIO ZS0520]AJE87601.1 sugar ABC transporter [Streptomyces albus]AOU81902.1 sugar ABC transporter [Streptomyces albus]AYN37587.1 carbohydrate ABC transporter permease [Streptomyces albus]
MPEATRSPKREGRLWPAHLVLSLGAVLTVFPLLWQVLTSFKSFGESTRVPPTIWPHHWEWSNYATVFDSIPFTEQFLNTLLMALLRTAAQLLLCSLAAYAFARIRFPGRQTIFLAFLAVLMVPGELFLLPQYQIMQNLGWLNSMQALVVPGMFSAFGTFLLRQFFMGLPVEVEEAARLDGANPFTVYWRIALPLARPGLLALGILTFLWSWNDLMWPLIVNTDPEQMPLSAGLASLQGAHLTDYPVLMAGSLLATLPVIVVFMVMQRQFIQGIAFSGMKG